MSNNSSFFLSQPMDFHMKQWKDQHESEPQHPSKIPKLFPEPHQHSDSALPLFVSEPNSKVNKLSAFPDSTSAATRFPRIGSYFSLAQWQELELQALIFRFILAGAAVPPQLLQPIKKSLLHSDPYFLHYSPNQPALLQSGYWGRAAIDPEPSRCRRTDGKKWRCSREVVSGQKYCERHMHRGRNRSRKPVESPTSTTMGGVGGGDGSRGASTTNISAPLVPAAAVSMRSPFDLLQLNHSCSEQKLENKGLFGYQNGDSRSGDGHILRHFIDDWPRSLKNTDSAEGHANSLTSSICLSISMPGNSASDVSLKLSTGNGEDTCPRNGNVESIQQSQLSWAGGWNPTSHVASMGGPLAEALRSSTSSSPTSVLHKVPGCSASEG